ncbi:MAG TPA: DUF1326 domain-containing protein [Bryobacteraceae bacterium]|nr:DUF1326 domain-containing protein [Bryobacteraceae bacterium]
MRNTVLALLLAAPALFATSLPRTDIRGEYIEARTADVYTGQCFANGEFNQVGELAVFGWSIQKGAYDGVKLDGLSVVGVIRANNSLGGIAQNAYPVKSVLIVDEKASPEQRLALKGFAKRMGGDLLQEIVRIDYQPITFEVKDGNIHSAEATLKAGSVVKVATRAIEDADQLCHNSETFYPPLTKLDHAMPAYTLANKFDGPGLNTRWSSPDNRGSFVGTFELSE